VIAVNISPDMGERIVISGLRDSILEVFPEIGECIINFRSVDLKLKHEHLFYSITILCMTMGRFFTFFTYIFGVFFNVREIVLMFYLHRRVLALLKIF
jgi:hypothetical protein